MMKELGLRARITRRVALVALGLLCAGRCASTAQSGFGSDTDLSTFRTDEATFARLAGRSKTLDAENVDVTIDGPIVTLNVTQTYRGGEPPTDMDDQAEFSLRTTHLAAICDYWITEKGRRCPGIARQVSSSRTVDYARLHMAPDHGIAEWIDEGAYVLSAYPVSNFGGTKEQGFTLIQAMAVAPDGSATLRYELSRYPVRHSLFKIRCASGTKGDVTASIPLSRGPPGDAALSGEVGFLSGGEKTRAVEIRYTLSTDAAFGEGWGTLDDSGDYFVAVTPASPDPYGCRRDQFLAVLGATSSLSADRKSTRPNLGDARLLLPTFSERAPKMSHGAWAKLCAFAVAAECRLDKQLPLEAFRAAGEAQVVAPGVPLLANPTESEKVQKRGLPLTNLDDSHLHLQPPCDEAAHARLDLDHRAIPDSVPARPARLAPPRPPIGPGAWFFNMEMPTIIPRFKGMERAHLRACHANLKRISHAIEMFNEDMHCNLFEHLLRGTLPRSPLKGIARREERVEELMSYDIGVPRSTPFGVISRWRKGLAYGTVTRTSVGQQDGCSDTHSSKLPDHAFCPISREAFELLCREQYLDSMPEDPGCGPDSAGNYCLASTHWGVFCLIHGDLDAEDYKSPSEQLRSEGYTDPAILAIAAGARPPSAPEEGIGKAWYWLLAGLTVVAVWARRRASVEQLRRHMKIGLMTLGLDIVGIIAYALIAGSCSIVQSETLEAMAILLLPAVTWWMAVQLAAELLISIWGILAPRERRLG